MSNALPVLQDVPEANLIRGDAQGQILTTLDNKAAAELGMSYCESCDKVDEDENNINKPDTSAGEPEEKDNGAELCSVCGKPIRSHEGREFICKHRFHKQCIRGWVDNKGTFCPICGKDLQLTNGRSYTKLIAQQIEHYYSTPLKHWGLQSTRKVQ